MMIVFILLPLLLLFLISIFNAISFYLLVSKEINVKEAFKLTCVASALNRFLFTGSGYIASSYFYRNKNLSFSNALGAFLLMEVCSISLWLPLGIYFGAQLLMRTTFIFPIILIVLLVSVLVRRNKVSSSIKSALSSFRNIGKSIFLVVVFIALTIVFYLLYYFFLFKLFNFQIDSLSIVKIVALSFTLGYLSPSPSGLGFKETGLVLLLIEKGIPGNYALSFVIVDRIIITFFWGVLGFLVGYDVIKTEISTKLKKILIGRLKRPLGK